MNYVVDIHGFPISFSVTRYGVHLQHDASLHRLIKYIPVSGTGLLSEQLKEKFRDVNHRDLGISRNSLVMEIWGHYYFERVFKHTQWLLSASFLFPLKDRLIKATREFDCAEWPIDTNRWLWDFLAFFTPLCRIFLRDRAII